MQSLRNLNLTDALVSLFSLQITLSSAAGGDIPLQMNGLVGFGIRFFTVCLAIYMIFDGVRRKKLDNLFAAPSTRQVAMPRLTGPCQNRKPHPPPPMKTKSKRTSAEVLSYFDIVLNSSPDLRAVISNFV